MDPVLYHCDCGKQTTPEEAEAPPVQERAYEHHALSQLFFCEECDAIRCPRCISEEVVCYYCPLCLFEVPTASVRGEFHRCARNCFLCPQCTHTLSVTGSDPSDVDDLKSAAANIGESPFYLTCTFCRWDSKEVGISFEKPTGLALQLQKAEAATPAIQSFEHVKDHLDPFVRAGLAAAAQSAAGPTAAIPRSSTLSSLPSRYGSLLGLANRSRPPAVIPAHAKDELEPYEALQTSREGAKKEQARVELLRNMSSLDEVASVEQKAVNPWQQITDVSQLRPTRLPLQAKRLKRCPTCKHILSKPEAKSTSIKYRIKLVACNYLPAMDLFRRPPITSAGTNRLSAMGSVSARPGQRNSTIRGAGVLGFENDPLRPGRTYYFEVAFVNPLYEAIQVRLDLPPTQEKGSGEAETQAPTPPFTITFPTNTFGINAFAEQWEYEDAEDENDMDVDDGVGQRKSKRRQPVGIVEKKANRTTVLLELAVDKDFVGPLKSHLLVTYFYSSETVPPPNDDKKAAQSESEIKSFSFWTLIKLGNVQPLQAKSRILNPSTFTAPPSVPE